MPRDDLHKGRVSIAYNAYFVTTVTHNRIPYFHDFYCARLLVTEMRRLHEENQLASLAWVIMPDQFALAVSVARKSKLISNCTTA